MHLIRATLALPLYALGDALTRLAERMTAQRGPMLRLRVWLEKTGDRMLERYQTLRRPEP